MAKYYLVVGKVGISNVEKLPDHQSDHIELIEHEAVEELGKQQAQGNEDAIVRVVEESTRIVVFAVHKGNIDTLR